MNSIDTESKNPNKIPGTNLMNTIVVKNPNAINIIVSLYILLIFIFTNYVITLTHF